MSNMSTWEQVKQTLLAGRRLLVTVKRHAPFGVFVAIPDVSFEGLVKIHEFTDGERMTPTEYPPVGAMVDVVVLGFQDKGQEIWLSMKPSRLRRSQENHDT